nr:hypothetical protein CFP56_57004 [Quercus suber]
MPSTLLRNQHITIIYPIECFVEKDWAPSQVEKWIKAAGGSWSSNLIGKTTHLVISSKVWRLQGEVVQEALAKNQKTAISSRAKEIKIVSGDWLKDLLFEQTKVKESTYRWDKLEPLDSDGNRKQTVVKNDNHNGALNPSVMANLLTESTEQYLDPKEKKKLERQMREQERLKREAEQDKDLELKKRKEEVRKIVEAGRKKASSALFSGKSASINVAFVEAIINTFVAARKLAHLCRRDRLCLKIQIYESNEYPHTYAVNLGHSGTSKSIANKILASMGSNFMTAMRTFKDAFSEQTGGVNWDLRFSHAVARSRDERLAREQRRVQGPKQGADILSKEQWFRYDPPRYGPRGCLTGDEKKTFPEIGPRDRGFETGKKGETRADIELWMTGGNIRAVPERQNFKSEGVSCAAPWDEFEQRGEFRRASPAPAAAAPARPMTSQEVIAQAMAEDAMADLDAAVNNYGTYTGEQKFDQYTDSAPAEGMAVKPDDFGFMGIDNNTYFDSFMDNFGTDESTGDYASSGNLEGDGQSGRSYATNGAVETRQGHVADTSRTQDFARAATAQQSPENSLAHTQVAQDGFFQVQDLLGNSGANLADCGTPQPYHGYVSSEDMPNFGMNIHDQKGLGKLCSSLGPSVLGKRKTLSQTLVSDTTASLSNKHCNMSNSGQRQTSDDEELLAFEQSILKFRGELQTRSHLTFRVIHEIVSQGSGQDPAAGKPVLRSDNNLFSILGYVQYITPNGPSRLELENVLIKIRECKLQYLLPAVNHPD